MRFYAHIKNDSPIDVLWRTKRLSKGWIDNILFEYQPKKNVYETGEITPNQLAVLKINESVVIEALGTTMLKIPTHMAPGAIQ